MNASYLYQEYHSSRCAKTSKEALDIFSALPSKAAKYKYVKEQIYIRYLGLGWEESHHPYLKAGYVYSPEELMEHFVKTVLPLANTKSVPDEPPLELPGLPSQLVGLNLGTKAADSVALVKEDKDFRKETMCKREGLEDSGYSDQLQDMQQYPWPIKRLKQIHRNPQHEEKFRIDMLFEHTDQALNQVFNVWSQGEVVEVIRVTEGKKDEAGVRIKWEIQYVELDEITREILLKSKWNPEKPGHWAWREDLHHKILHID